MRGHRLATSRTEPALSPPIAVKIARRAASMSKPTTGCPASISRAANALPISPSPTIPTGASALMIATLLPTLLRFDPGRLGIRRPAHDLALDKGAELLARHRGYE